MKHGIRFLLVVSLVLSVLFSAAAGAWAAPGGESAARYLLSHPNLALYLKNNPQVAQQVLTPGESAADLVSALVQAVDGFGDGYVARHPHLVLYLRDNPGVAQQVLDYRNLGSGGVSGSTYGSGENGGGNGGAFSDVPPWARSAVGQMARMGIIKGIGNGLFGPNQLVTRAQLAALLTREFELTVSGSTYSFSDVPPTFWAYRDIEAAAPYMDYWNGPNGTYLFHPTDFAVREDIIASMVEAAGLGNQTPDPSDLSKFVDAGNISPNLVDLVSIAVAAGLVTGSQDQSGNWHLAPQAYVTRAETAVLLSRALRYSVLAP